MLRALLALALTVWCGAVVAQSWATRDVCHVDTPRIHDNAIAPELLQDLRAKAAEIPNSVGRFWEIRAPNGAVSHLWGTHHGNDPIVLDLPEEVLSAVTKARVFAPETDWVAKSRSQIDREYSYEGLWRSDPLHRSPLGLLRGIENNIRARLDGIGMGRDSLEYLTLAGLAEILLSHPCDDFASGTYPSQDSYLQTRAAIGGAQTLGLEPTEAFMQTLGAPENRDLALAVINLYASYLDPVSDNSGRATDFALYLRGEIGVAMAWERQWLATRFGPKIGPPLQDRVDAYLLSARNAGFLTTILPELEAGGVFIAVGSWHLPGEAGMVALLRAQGYDVERVVLRGEAPTP